MKVNVAVGTTNAATSQIPNPLGATAQSSCKHEKNNIVSVPGQFLHCKGSDNR
jgi:hypothetical protein